MPHRRLLLLTTCAALAIAAGARADDAADAQVEELIVTAQKREQKLLDVPIAVTAYGGGFLDDIGVQEFEELSLFVPGFEVQNQSPNNPGFVMRGITSDSGEATNEPRVSVFQDGVSISKSRGSYIELFDLQRVEIAKGPQSTLYGRGALIGAVNIVQNKADVSRRSGSLRVEAGNDSYRMAEAVANLPVNDTFAVRLAGRVKARDGYVENLLGGEDFNSTDTVAVRGAVRWKPDDRLTADLIVNYQEDNPSGTSFKSLTFLPADPATGAVLGDLGRNSGAALTTAQGFEGDQPLGLERTVWGATALVEYRINETLSLSSISAYREFDGTEVFDPDGFGLPMLVFAEDARGEQASQELRLNYASGERLNGFLGVSYFHEEGRQRVPLQINEKIFALVSGRLLPRPNGLPLPVINTLAPAALKSVHRETFANYGETDSYDVYGDVSFKLLDNLELAAGVRYTYDDKRSGFSGTLDNGGSVAGGSTPTLARGLIVQPTVGGRPEYRTLDDSGLTYRLVARWAVAEGVSLYASHARGRRPKVLSAASPTAPNGPVRFTELPAEVVDSFEVGAKAALFDNTLSLEGAAYSYDYQNFQTSIRNAAGQIVAINAGEASAEGFEAQLNYRPVTQASVFATYAYNHARFGNGLFEGNRFRLSPDHSFSVGARLSAQVLEGTLTFTPTYTWQSRVFFDSNNDQPRFQAQDAIVDETQKAYGLMNLRLAYEPTDGPWRIEAFVINALDKAYIKDAGNTGDAFGIATFIAGEPRYYGFGVSYRF
jgi:iron complex outermembrane receptor protein